MGNSLAMICQPVCTRGGGGGIPPELRSYGMPRSFFSQGEPRERLGSAGTGEYASLSPPRPWWSSKAVVGTPGGTMMPAAMAGEWDTSSHADAQKFQRRILPLACIYLVVLSLALIAGGAVMLLVTTWQAKGAVFGAVLAEDEKVDASYARFQSQHAPRMASEKDTGFPARPARSSWPQRLEQGIRDGQSDPCSADVISTMGWKAGLGARVNGFVNDIWVAIYLGLSLSLCRSHAVESIWLRHFENPANIGICLAERCNHIAGGSLQSAGAWAGGFGAAPVLAYVDHSYMDDIRRLALDSVYTYKAETWSAIRTTLQRIPQFDSIADDGTSGWPRYLGVHIRHGDKFMENSLLDFQTYAGQIRPQLVLHNLKLVYVASDDNAACAEMRKLLEGSAEVVEQPRLPATAYGWEEAYKNDTALQAVLVDIEALRQSEVFVGTASSNIGRLVYSLRSKSKPSISLDQGGDFLWNG